MDNPQITYTKIGTRRAIYRFAADFETTVQKNTSEQKETYVWSACSMLIDKGKPSIQSSIAEFFKHIGSFAKAVIKSAAEIELCYYFHNLKFDGSFILYYLANCTKLQDVTGQNIKPWEMEAGQFQYLIADRGGWFNITIQLNKKERLIFRDSLKIIPMGIKAMGKAFNTPHKKKEMDYKRHDRIGVPITKEEMEYIENDVYVLSEALNTFMSQGYYKNTVGSNCKDIFFNKFYKGDAENDMPDLYGLDIDNGIHGSENAGRFIRKAYKGGWCYCKEKKTVGKGWVGDVNSLYPSMMSSESGSRYPVGLPTWWTGEIPEMPENSFYFVRLSCDFDIKAGYLPFIQLKGLKGFSPTMMYEHNVNKFGTRERVELTMTFIDYALFKEHYNISNLEILDGCYFKTEIGIFDEYIDYWKKRKIEDTISGNKGLRTIDKLFLNNLYGQMSTDPDGNIKILMKDCNDKLSFRTAEEPDSKVGGYIAVGAAITSYARNFTIRAAQKNYDNFCYSDTDSIHCTGDKKDAKGIKVDATAFCCWKIESEFDSARFVRQKTYVEHTIKDDGEPVEPYFSIKAAGMPKASKDILVQCLGNFTGKTIIKEKSQVYEDDCLSLDDFDINLCVGGKLRPKQVKGGTLLVDTTFKMRS